jgi:arylsulfatase A-like enzyme
LATTAGAGAGRRAAFAGTALLLLAAGAYLAFRGASGPPKPDIVLIVWDTCRGDRVEVNGYAHPTTPRLKSLAAQGTTFRRCFTPSPWTPPAHASLFTGLLPRAHGLREGMFGDRIRPGIPLLAETLRDEGYETVCVAANAAVSVITGLDAGFEHKLPFYRTDDGGETGDGIRDRVREWTKRRRETGGSRRPVFLFVNLMDTHLPYVCDAPDIEAVRGPEAVEGARRAAAAIGDMEAKAIALGRGTIAPETLRDLSVAYDAAVRRDDRLTGEILDHLRAEGLLDGAFVAITSDHGENLGEHGQLNHLVSVYEPVLHVPLVVSWPGRFEGGRVEDAEVRLQDLYPTILEAAGVAVPGPCGKDATSLAERPLRPRPLVSEFGPMPLALATAKEALPDAPPEVFERIVQLHRAVREPASSGGRKLISLFRVESDQEPVVVREELYDLVADPGETKDLLAPGGHPDIRAEADRLRATGKAGR